MSDLRREILLEQVVARLQGQRDRLYNALLNLRHHDGCFCEVSIGNPMYGGTHTNACARAQEALSEIERVKREEIAATMRHLDQMVEDGDIRFVDF